MRNQPNPEKDWGPMQRAPGYAIKDAEDRKSGVHDTRVLKRERNQGKNAEKMGDAKRRKEEQDRDAEGGGEGGGSADKTG